MCHAGYDSVAEEQAADADACEAECAGRPACGEWSYSLHGCRVAKTLAGCSLGEEHCPDGGCAYGLRAALTERECQLRCDGLEGCAAVTTGARASSSGAGACELLVDAAAAAADSPRARACHASRVLRMDGGGSRAPRAPTCAAAMAHGTSRGSGGGARAQAPRRGRGERDG